MGFGGGAMAPCPVCTWSVCFEGCFGTLDSVSLCEPISYDGFAGALGTALLCHALFTVLP